MAIQFSLNKLPWYTQIAVFVGLSVAGVAVFYLYYASPLQQDIAARQVRLAGLLADINKGRVSVRQLPQMQAQVTEFETKLQALKAVLPEEKDAADLLRRIQTLASQSTLTIRAFRPQPVVTKSLHAEWPISLELDGTFHNLALFLDRVSKFSRIIHVSGLVVKAKEKPDSRSTITAECVATTFVLLDTPAKPPVKPALPPKGT